ncbi:unnamed protein product [Schistosoma margrebowiei]|uniref:Uncharacterized protein n=1 Tax=Schistosoma margrebowiei TaxID=48269 RepID=A0A183N2H2_9TREM|nr:unnamed protein product [Schistosoma margrebowiei]
MWELQEFVGDGTLINILLQVLVLNKAFVISQPGVIKFGGSGCDVDLRPVVCSEVAKMFVIGNDANCVPERITVGNVLVHDSEPLVSQNFVDSPQTAHLDLENQEPCKLETILKNSISTSTFEPSLIHQPLACTDKNDLLNTLNNMHSLLQTKIKQGILLESNFNNKKNATLLFPSLSNKSFDSIKPEIPKYESLLENDANSSVVTRSNSCNLDLNNGHSFPSNNENRRSGSWLRKHPIDNGADIVDTVSFITVYGLIIPV